jgi:hypothetical protein
MRGDRIPLDTPNPGARRHQPLKVESADDVRREMVESGKPEHDLAVNQGQTWTTEQMAAEFEVTGFAAPFVVVRRRADGALGTLEFTHSPRVYFGWLEDRDEG